MSDLLALATIAVAYIAILMLVARIAPLGWEDTAGFHFGPCPGERDAHDALRDGGEGGEFRTIHGGSSK